ncbi:MAG: response regulator [Meiothermus sp.]|nr:response regulator [Meiothermus sp.]
MDRCVLLVDDDASNRGFLERGLGYEGYRVLSARGGLEGLELARRERPDLILLDVMMPGLDGFAVAEALRADGLEIPILFFSARDEPEVAERAERMGAPLLVKPMPFAELLAELERVLGCAEVPRIP